MKNLVFMLWILLFPLAEKIGRILELKLELDKNPCKESIEIFAKLLAGISYIGIAYLLYER